VTTPSELRKDQARRFGAQLGIDGGALYRAAMASWSNLGPQSVTFDRALSVAGAALKAANEEGTSDHD
jgi:hypothetical protein